MLSVFAFPLKLFSTNKSYEEKILPNELVFKTVNSYESFEIIKLKNNFEIYKDFMIKKITSFSMDDKNKEELLIKLQKQKEKVFSLKTEDEIVKTIKSMVSWSEFLKYIFYSSENSILELLILTYEIQINKPLQRLDKILFNLKKNCPNKNLTNIFRYRKEMNNNILNNNLFLSSYFFLDIGQLYYDNKKYIKHYLNFCIFNYIFYGQNSGKNLLGLKDMEIKVSTFPLIEKII